MKRLLLTLTSACLLLILIGWIFKPWRPKQEHIHPALPPNSFYSFTLQQLDASIPCLEAEIEGISFPVKLDTGYDAVLSLPKQILEKLTQKSPLDPVIFGSIKGKTYQSPSFSLPKLRIGNLSLVNFPVEESNWEFEQDINLGSKVDLDQSQVVARLGWRAFVGTVLLIDLSNSVAICCDSIETLKERGYSLDQFVSIEPLAKSPHNLEFAVNMEEKRVKCLLDTGSTLNLLHTASSSLLEEKPELGVVDPKLPLPPTTLHIGEKILGSCVFHETRLPFGAEAILGVEFLKTQIVCIDFIHNKLYLCPVSKQEVPGI